MSKAEQIYSYVKRKISYINGLGDTGLKRGLLANVRRGLGRKPGELPELWGMLFDNLPESLFSIFLLVDV